MANNSAPKRTNTSSSEEDGPPKKTMKVETEIKPPPKQYKDVRKLLTSLSNLLRKTEKDSGRIITLLSRLEQLCSSAVVGEEGDLLPAAMVVQMHLKNAFFNSGNIKDGDNIKMFLSGLEDGSEGKSEKDNSVYVFYAKQATPLWYRWNEEEQTWEWTPEKDWSLWMPCSTTKVSHGMWTGEEPATENVEIIHYLDSVRPVTTEEVYLSEQFDVAILLSGLAAVDGARERVKAIATILKDQKMLTQDAAKNLSKFREVMNTLIDGE